MYYAPATTSRIGGQPCVLNLDWLSSKRYNLGGSQQLGYNLNSSYSPVPLDVDYRPAAPNDPGVDGGLDLSLYATTDKDGVSRPQGAGWDIGPYEFIPPPAPVADAGPDRTIVDDDGDGFVIVTLDGSNSHAPGGTIGGYLWREGQTRLLGSEPLQVAALVLGTHTITLAVTDSNDVKATDTVVITVASTTPGDADGDGDVDLDDFAILKTNFGR